MSLVSGCLSKDFLLSLARPRAPLLCAKAASHWPGDSRRPTPKPRWARGGAVVQRPKHRREADAIHSQGAARLWISLLRVAKFLGTLQNAGRGAGEEVAKVRDPGWVRGMLWRCELPGRHLHLTTHPKTVLSASHGERLELRRGCISPLPISPCKCKEIAVGCSFESIQASCHGSP